MVTIDALVDANHILHAYQEDLTFGKGVEGFMRLITANAVDLLDAQLTINDMNADLIH